MSDIKEKIIHMIKNLPANANFDDILEAIILQKQIEESLDEINKGQFTPHKKVMVELNRRLKGIK